jgi:hypothetical protein
MVELKVMPDGQVPGRLEFAFVRAGESQGEIRYTWEVSAELLETLRRDGELSEEVLHQQLARAIAEIRTVDTRGSELSPLERIQRGA